MQAEEKDYFKLLAYNLFSYAIDSNSIFKEVYAKNIVSVAKAITRELENLND